MSGSPDRSELDSKRRQLLAAMGGGATLSMAGCSGIFADEEGNGNGDTDIDPDEIPMDGEFTASLAANPSTFDPTVVQGTGSAACTTLMYETLVEFDYNSEPQGALAADWEQEEETTYRFDLREGVEFHSGEEMTAQDVSHSFQRIIGTVNDAAVSTWYDDDEIVDDYTIRFQLSQPHAPFLDDITGVPIVPEDVGDPKEDDSLEEESRGTGPFVFENFEAEDRVELTRNDNYWFEETDNMVGKAPWESVTLRVVPEQTSQQEALETGELDLIDNAAPVDLNGYDEDDDYNVANVTGIGFDFIAFPVQNSPYTNEKFRRGITRLVPVDDVIESIWSGYAQAIGGSITPGLDTFWDEEFDQGLRDDYVGQDKERAKELLDQAFEEEDIEKPFEVNLITNQNRTRERWMEVIQQKMDETEYFDASLDIQSFDALVPFLIGGEAAESQDIVGIGWTGSFDPNGHVEQLLHSENKVPDGFNWILYDDEEMDQLIDDGQTTVDHDERVNIYQDIAEKLAEEVPYAFMWTSDEYHVHTTSGVTNFQMYPHASYPFAPLYRPYLDQVAWQPE